MDETQLKQRLMEGGEPPEDAEMLAETARFLRHLPQAEARSLHRAQIQALLLSELPQRKSRRQRLAEWYPLALLLSQTRVIQADIWLSSAVALLIGLAVTLTMPRAEMLLFSALAPLVAAAGVALLYDENIVQMLEIEETTRASARVLLLARLTLIFGFNLALGLCGSGVLALVDSQLSLMPLVFSWLAPMSFLCALAFMLSVLLVNSLASMSFSLFLWVVHVILYYGEGGSILWTLLAMPGLAEPFNRPLIFAAAALMVAVGLWAVGIIERKGSETWQ